MAASPPPEPTPAPRVDEPTSAKHSRGRYGVSAVVVAAVVVATTGVVVYNKAHGTPDKAFTQLGVRSAVAACQPTLSDPVTVAVNSPTGSTIGPGTSDPHTTHITYPTVPPSSGKYLAVPVFPSQAFYTLSDVPAVEKLVHNLEHGYTIVWYDPSLNSDQQDQLKLIAGKIRVGGIPKFIAAPWDTSRGPFAGGAKVAMTHWGVATGARQLCGAVSGEAIEAFVKAHPASDSPDPDAA
jgi:hypothetical protein